MNSLFLAIFQIIFIPALSPLAIGVIRKFKAKLQNRHGASIFQPYFDLQKLLRKDETVSKDASWIFSFAPYILFSVTLFAALGIPLVNSVAAFPFAGDFLVFIYVLALGTFFLALSGMDAGSSFGGFGSSREMTISALAEGGLLFSLFTAVRLSSATTFSSMIPALSLLSLQQFLPLLIAGIAYCIVLVAETNRMPIDNPATHLELTMIHEAMILEYSGKKLALMEWASANKLLLFIVLGANLFFPWGISQGPFELQGFAISFLILLLKIFVAIVAIALLESTVAKLRFFRVPDLLLTSLILGVIAIGITVF